MANDGLHNLQNALHALKQSAIRTSQGTFVKLDDLQKLIDEEGEHLTKETIDQLMGPRTFEAAKARIAADKEIMGQFPTQQERSAAGDGTVHAVPGDL